MRAYGQQVHETASGPKVEVVESIFVKVEYLVHRIHCRSEEDADIADEVDAGSESPEVVPPFLPDDQEYLGQDDHRADQVDVVYNSVLVHRLEVSGHRRRDEDEHSADHHDVFEEG